MRTMLHIKSDTADTLADRVIANHLTSPDLRIEIVDLSAAQTDYGVLLAKIFAADSVAVW